MSKKSYEELFMERLQKESEEFQKEVENIVKIRNTSLQMHRKYILK